MCYICKEEPCQIGCPLEDVSSYNKCAECGGAIYSGQKHYCLGDNKKFHLECIEHLYATEVLDILNINPTF